MIKFTECLNDTWDYFFLGDPLALTNFQLEYNLSSDLIYEFTSNDSGDLVVEKGVLIPMSGVANYPYTIIFNTDNEPSIFDKQVHQLQFKKTGYFLNVINEEICLMTIPYLKSWTTETAIKNLSISGICPRVKIPNALYLVEICGGETLQDTGWEPTFEFTLKAGKEGLKFAVEDVNFKFKVDSKEY